MKILLEEKNGIAILKFNNGVTNAISTDFLNDFFAKIDNAENKYNGLILTGNEKFFSMGFNLPELLIMNKESFTEFYNLFNELIVRLYSLPIPTCSVITGHAIAGGFIIALATDYRFAVSDKKIGLNEINIGVPVPYLAQLILKEIVNDRIFKNLVYYGDFLTTNSALDYGLIDEIYSLEEIIDKTIEKISKLSYKEKKAFGTIKTFSHKEVINIYKNTKEEDTKHFLECWLSEKAQSLLKEASKKF